MICNASILLPSTPNKLLSTGLLSTAALVAWRARRATILRVAAPFFFLLLALLIDRALQVCVPHKGYMEVHGCLDRALRLQSDTIDVSAL
jgi:hypothetical protein